jgi:nucleotide-binding universal stress UspA family protein
MVNCDSFLSGDVIQQDQDEIDKEFTAAEVEFRSALRSRANTLGWRSATTLFSLADYLAYEARSADLFITGVDRSRAFDRSRHTSLGDLVMQIGRPVLIVPKATQSLKLERILVGWKDTSETRRAIWAALPMLKKAAHVTIVEIASEEKLAFARGHLEDVAGWLKRHGIASESLALRAVGDDAMRLNAISQEQQADVVVAGAYGHSRLREFVLGGVTHDLLLCSSTCSLVSH